MDIDGDKHINTWAAGCHLAGLAMFTGIPFGNIIGPLVLWLIKKNEYEFVDLHGKAALNFQISMTIYGAIAFLLCMMGVVGGEVAGSSAFRFALFGLFPLVFIIGLVDVILLIIAAVKASNGEIYQYPFTMRFVK